jgi:predicted dehydrogenase
MSENKLRTAVLGLSGRAELLLEAAAGLDYFQIEAVADKDSDLADKVAEKYGCAAYDDYRQLVIQNQLDCLLVAAGMHSCDEHIRTAIKKKCNILKLAPPARDFEEAVEFVQLAEDEDVKFIVANMNRFSPSFLALRECLQEGGIDQVFLVTVTCAVGNQAAPAWQSDPKRAGGGVLLHSCYELVDQIVLNFGVPEQVYSLNTNIAGDRQQRLCLTEDTGLVTMKFSDTLIGNVIASRRIGVKPEREFLTVYGKDKIVSVSESRFSVGDCLGRVSDELECKDDALVCMRKILENFGLAILFPDENKLCSVGRENLKVMAVIESAYLSARTGMPEEPGRILQMASRGAGKSIST